MLRRPCSLSSSSRFVHVSVLATLTMVASCAPSPTPSASPDVVDLPSASAAPTAVTEAAPPPKAPFVLAKTQSAHGDLVVTPTHLYWLETHGRRAALGPRVAPASKGLLGGAALMCNEAGGKLMSVERATKNKAVVAELDYRPFSLKFDGKRLYWTGAPCASGAAKSSDPEWLWAFDTTRGGEPTTLGARNRNYLDMVTTPNAAYVSDRFGYGGTFRFVDGGEAELIVPETEQPWGVAADERSYFWSDRSWTLWETDLKDRKAKKHLELGDMPSDAHLVGDTLVIRTSKEVLLLTRSTMAVRKRISIPEYGDRGDGAVADGRYYLWANGLNEIWRIDLQSGNVTRAIANEVRAVSGLAYDRGTVFVVDRRADAILAWQSPIFAPSSD